MQDKSSRRIGLPAVALWSALSLGAVGCSDAPHDDVAPRASGPHSVRTRGAVRRVSDDQLSDSTPTNEKDGEVAPDEAKTDDSDASQEVASDETPTDHADTSQEVESDETPTDHSGTSQELESDETARRTLRYLARGGVRRDSRRTRGLRRGRR